MVARCQVTCPAGCAQCPQAPLHRDRPVSHTVSACASDANGVLQKQRLCPAGCAQGTPAPLQQVGRTAGHKSCESLVCWRHRPTRFAGGTDQPDTQPRYGTTQRPVTIQLCLAGCREQQGQSASRSCGCASWFSPSVLLPQFEANTKYARSLISASDSPVFSCSRCSSGASCSTSSSPPPAPLKPPPAVNEPPPVKLRALLLAADIVLQARHV
jgi:hypothetical protein